MRSCFIKVEGRVQGVYYRASTQKKATQLSLTGWVRNLPDGQVEIFACGNEAAVQQLIDWCWTGPSGAHVTNVVISEAEPSPATGFSIRR